MFSKTTSRYASLESAASHDTRGISTAPVEATRSKRPRVSTGRVSAPPPVAADTAPSAERGAARAPDGRATVTSCNRCSAAPIDVICEMGASPRPAPSLRAGLRSGRPGIPDWAEWGKGTADS